MEAKRVNRKPNRGGGRFNKPANRGGGRGRGGGKGNTGDSARGDNRGKIFIVNDTPQRPQQHNMPGSGGGGLISMSDSSQDMIEDLLKNLKEEGSTDGELAKGNLGSGAHDGLFEELVRMGFQEQDVLRALAVTQDRNAALDYLCVGPLYIFSP